SQICNVFLVSGIHGVPDEYLSASSEFDAQHAAKYGRINTTFVNGSHFGAWAAKNSTKNEFIQVQLKRLSLIQAIQTQGRNITGDDPGNAQHVTNYHISYGTNSTTWISLNDSTGHPKRTPLQIVILRKGYAAGHKKREITLYIGQDRITRGRKIHQYQ
ncbi:hypothetical protein ACJMK2_025180, partial [Sinanodonta woodiana]